MGFGREMDGCGQCMKYSMFVSNFIIFIGGLVVLGIGIWTLVDKSYVNELLGTDLFMGAVYILIVTGAIVSLIAFLGCLGAVKEVRCMLLMYFIIVFLIFITMLIGGILGYVFREKVKSTMYKEMESSIRRYSESPEVRKAWDNTQINLKCCGIQDHSSWGDELPNSCCKQRTPSYCTPWETGCLYKAEKFVQDHASVIGGAGIGVACIMLLGMIFSCALFMMIE